MNELQKALYHEKYIIFHRYATLEKQASSTICAEEPDLSFGGAWIVARENLARQIPLLEDEGGWSFTFSSNTSIAQIETWCFQFMQVAFKRWDAMQRWANRKQ